MNNFKNFLNELEILIQKYKSILNKENDISNNSLSLFNDDNKILSLFNENNNTLSLFNDDNNNNNDENNDDDTLSLFDDENNELKNILDLFQGNIDNKLDNLDNLDNLFNNKSIEFNNKSIELKNSTVFFFYNPKCPACIKTKPSWDIIVDNINKFFKETTKLFDIFTINVSESSNDNLCKQFDINYVPTFIIYDNINKNIFVKKEGSLSIDEMLLSLSDFYKFMNKTK